MAAIVVEVVSQLTQGAVGIIGLTVVGVGGVSQLMHGAVGIMSLVVVGDVVVVDKVVGDVVVEDKVVVVVSVVVVLSDAGMVGPPIC